ncbi:MAG: DUF1998 domain-containing protein [Xanthomonadales bacterium]|nr:DUF1998 domain-containing protein [Xanthomonadales bacterium]
MDFPGPESLIQAGLDTWPQTVVNDPARRITNEPALAYRLGVDFFVTPPPDDDTTDATVAWLRFPRWHACTKCGAMKCANLHDAARPTCDEQGCGNAKMQQMRFVAACRNGHLRDFPWIEWLAARENAGMDVGQIGAALQGGARLRLQSTGESGAIGLLVQLVKGGKVLLSRSLAGAFGGNPDGDTPLLRIGVQCESENPAIGISPGDKACRSCDAPLYVVLRGAGNLYFPEVESAIHIPADVPGELPEQYRELLEDDAFVSSLLFEASRSEGGKLRAGDAKRTIKRDKPWLPLDDSTLESFTISFNQAEPLGRFRSDPALLAGFTLLVGDDLGEEDALQAILNKYLREKTEDPDVEWRSIPHDLLGQVKQLIVGGRTEVQQPGDLDPRLREYPVFSKSEADVQGLPKSILKLRSRPVADYGDIVQLHFDHVGLLDTLRETRVLKGFSRLYARPKKPDEYRNLMWRNAPQREGERWLPATMVYGEGIFLKFSASRLAHWEHSWGQKHQGRLEAVEHNLGLAAERRGGDAPRVNARLIMIHTFAHMLINQLVLESGYGSSSLRERIYWSEPSKGDPGMAGLLIYTASGDSEGSMGGLVRMGEPGTLETVVRKALENGLWCSSDPVCIESKGQGPDNCNLAACHSCALLPETSCELQNRLLDRGTVLGTLECPGMGYFSGLARGDLSAPGGSA